MILMSKPYLRKHRDRWLIEQKIDGRTKHLCSITVEEMLNLKGVQFIDDKAYRSTKKKRKKRQQKFSQVLLSELKNRNKEPTPEEIEASLYEITK